MLSINALPSLRQLRYLVAVADRLNFRAAAEGCFVTQSTLSAGIKELEGLLGVELIERDKRRVRLTAAGEQIVAKARGLLAQAQDLIETARRAGEPLAGTFHLGVIPTIAPFLLPRVLPHLRDHYAQLKLYLREDVTERLIDRLRAAELDAALVALPYDTGDLALRELFRDEFWFVARNDDPLAHAQGMSVERLAPREIVLLEEGHCLREHAIVACGARDRGAAPTVEATSLTTLVQMVEGGLGVTLLPEMTIRAGILNGTALVAHPFASQAPARTIALASRPTSARDREVELLAEFIVERAAPKLKAGVSPRPAKAERSASCDISACTIARSERSHRLTMHLKIPPTNAAAAAQQSQTPEERQLAELIVQALNLETSATEIDPEGPLYGEGLGLDSIDILEMSLAISKTYGVQLRSDDPENSKIFRSLRSLSAYVQSRRTK